MLNEEAVIICGVVFWVCIGGFFSCLIPRVICAAWWCATTHFEGKKTCVCAGNVFYSIREFTTTGFEFFKLVAVTRWIATGNRWKFLQTNKITENGGIFRLLQRVFLSLCSHILSNVDRGGKCNHEERCQSMSYAYGWLFCRKLRLRAAVRLGSIRAGTCVRILCCASAFIHPCRFVCMCVYVHLRAC